MIRPDVWLTPHNENYDLAAKRARAEKEGAAAWVDREGYRKWVVAQRANFEAAVDRQTSAGAGEELLREKPAAR